jgi:hypothetical protein
MDDGFTLRDAVNADVEKTADTGPKDKRKDFQLEKHGHTQLFRFGGSSPVLRGALPEALTAVATRDACCCTQPAVAGVAFPNARIIFRRRPLKKQAAYCFQTRMSYIN